MNNIINIKKCYFIISFSTEGGLVVFICRYLPANKKNLSLCPLSLCGES
jgi:hypothetical protein